ncbi:TMV resistance protein N-like [Senna tora]|uniref:TMV resistance protein N-like n=1 Tax=Senna tora TaxID=362788 RepID=A0A834XCM1_9FABA|nr:TMV resistance protein N-like [Senna tora]
MTHSALHQLAFVDDPIGMETRAEAVENLLHLDSKDVVCVVGTHGMSGIGKTTLAAVVYNRISHRFTPIDLEQIFNLRFQEITDSDRNECSKLQLWHSRLGHPSLVVVKSVLKECIVYSKPLELVVSDVWGPALPQREIRNREWAPHMWDPCVGPTPNFLSLLVMYLMLYHESSSQRSSTPISQSPTMSSKFSSEAIPIDVSHSMPQNQYSPHANSSKVRNS